MRVVWGLAALSVLACSEAPPDPAGSGGAAGAAGAPADAGDGAPVIASVLVSGALDYDDRSVTLTVDVNDPDGLADIVGGKLYSKDKSKFLGAFDQVSGGTFTKTVSWLALNDVEPIILGVGAKTTRTVLIEFSDTTHKGASVEQSLELSCAACANCKACGKCTAGKCTLCEPSLSAVDCAVFCSSLGMMCSCAYSACGDTACAVNGCNDPCPASGCACECI
ncbi:MAG: hypothetical protein L6Q84_09325 [Polyangiaceae bacterium]|nr:hypothetical protein [Polyangiaceae bacterium]